MQTKKFKDLTHEFEAKVDDVIEGMLYKDSSNSWYIFHNSSSYKGGWPADFEKLKKEYGVTSSWYLGNENSDTESVHSIVTHKPRKDIEEDKADKDALRASRRAEKRAEQKKKDMKTLFVGEPESIEAERVTDVSRFVSGAEVIFTKLSSLGDSFTSPGQLYYCSDEKTWFFLSNSNLFCGDKPQTNWIQIKERTGMEYSMSIPTDHIDAFAHCMHFEDKFKPDASYKYTPPVHPSSSKLRATSDSDIKGDSVPRKKNIDTLLILGL